MTPPTKPDNSTQAEIHALNEKVDSLATQRLEDIDRHRDNRKRSQWIIGISVGIFTLMIGTYLESVRSELVDVGLDIKELVRTTGGNGTKIEVLSERIEQTSELKDEINKLDDRLRNLERSVRQ